MTQRAEGMAISQQSQHAEIANVAIVSDDEEEAEKNEKNGDDDDDDASSASHLHHNRNIHTSDGAKRVDQWILPIGAEFIIRQLAAEHILHQLLDRCCDICNNNTNTRIYIDFQAIADIAKEFPGTCNRTYEFQIDTRDEENRLRSLYPLAILCCLNPPVVAVEAVYNAYPQAISILDHAKGGSPLLYACSFEASRNVVDFLIQKYPEAVSISRKDGAIPLAMACSYRAPPEVLDLLIRNYPQGIKITSSDGWYPLHAAVACEAPRDAVQRLHEAFPESVVDTQNSTQSTALHLACSKRSSPNVVEFLLQVAPESVHMLDTKHMSPWFWAVYAQSLEVIQLFLEKFPGEGQLPVQSQNGICLLHFAVRHNTADVVDFLAQRYPFMLVSRTRTRGMTPLHTACQRHRPLDVIQSLVKHCPRCLFLRNQRGRLPLDEARAANATPRVIEFLEKEHERRQTWWW
mmetsp:Transcript_19756/g.54412  ORF Transcript_19756/g.54412 Transcript_19756/m.54412 type:complete len:461 (-) Transcript_19756:3185-4567(-)